MLYIITIAPPPPHLQVISIEYVVSPPKKYIMVFLIVYNISLWDWNTLAHKGVIYHNLSTLLRLLRLVVKFIKLRCWRLYIFYYGIRVFYRRVRYTSKHLERVLWYASPWDYLILWLWFCVALLVIIYIMSWIGDYLFFIVLI